MSTTDPNPLSREELLIRSITTLLSIVKLQTAEPSEPPNKNKFQLLLDRIALLFVRKPAGEVYSVIISHAFVEDCDYDKRESDDSGSPKHKGNNTITLYLYDTDPHVSEPTSKKLPTNFQHEWLEKILREGHLTVEQHAQHLEYLVRRLAKVDKDIGISDDFTNFRKYIYFSSCQKIKKRLEKSARHDRKVRPFPETLFAIQTMQAVGKISSTPLPVRSQDKDADPLQDEDSDPLQDEAWIKMHAKVLGFEFTLVAITLESTTVQHIALDLRGIENLQKLICAIVKAIHDMINKICQVYSTKVHPDKVTETAENVHKHLDRLLRRMWLLRLLLNFSPSLRRFLKAVPEGPALWKWLKKISRWEMAANDIISPHIQKRLKTSRLSIYIIQPPPLRHPGSMATLDDTFAAIFENADDIRVKAAQSLGELAERELGRRPDSTGLWQLVYEWHHGASKQQKNGSLWEKSFPGTVHCESTIATIRTIHKEKFQTVLSKSAIKKKNVFKELSKNIAWVSKGCCFSCASYIKLLSEGKLSLGGTHGKCYPWSIPQHCCPDVRDDMLNLLKQTIEPILRKRIRSPTARSDSSAGSDAQPPKEQPFHSYHSYYLEQELADQEGDILGKDLED